MNSISKILVILGVIICAYVLAKILSAPLRIILKLLFNALLGLIVLFLVNLFASAAGITLELNLINCLVAGIFGFPGVIALILIQILL